MEISPRTVEAIKDRLMERFGSKNTAGLVFFAVKNNLIDSGTLRSGIKIYFRNTPFYNQLTGSL